MANLPLPMWETSACGDISKEEVARICKELFNDSIKKIQRIMAKKMQEMGGFPGLN
jgi:hypothetical protein